MRSDQQKGGLLGEIEDEAEKAEEAIDSLNRKLLGLDQINTLSSNTSSENGNIDDLSLITSELSKYSSSLDNISSKITNSVEKIMTWLGYVKEVNSETGETNWLLGEGFTNIEKIGIGLGTIGSLFAGLLGTKMLGGVISGLGEFNFSLGAIGTKLSGIGASLGSVGIIIGVIALVVGTLYATNEEFRKSVDGLIGSLGNTLKPIFDGILEIVEDIWVGIQPIAEFLWKAIGYTLTRIVDQVKEFIDILNFILVPIIEIISSGFEFLSTTIGGILKIIGDIGNGLFDLFTGKISLNGLFDKISESFSSVGDMFDEVGNKMLNAVGGLIKGCVNALIGFLNFFIKQMNKGIDGINNILNVELFGKKIGVTIPHIPEVGYVSFDFIPKFANGGVLSEPTIGLMGEYSGAKTNPEIVSPQNIMRETFMEAVLPMVNAILQGDERIVKAVSENKTTDLYINGRKISEEIYDDLSNVAVRRGKSLAYQNY